MVFLEAPSYGDSIGMESIYSFLFIFIFIQIREAICNLVQMCGATMADYGMDTPKVKIQIHILIHVCKVFFNFGDTGCVLGINDRQLVGQLVSQFVSLFVFQLVRQIINRQIDGFDCKSRRPLARVRHVDGRFNQEKWAKPTLMISI